MSNPREPGTPHRLPGWAAEATAAALLERGLPAGLLDLHRRLVLAAQDGCGRPQYLAAAGIVRDLLNHAITSPVRDGLADVTGEVHAAVGEILTVLRTWDPATRPFAVAAWFDQANAWRDHARAVVATARLGLQGAPVG
uniref:hypothetical protein n=1 Tax=Amycolatopsis sp. CA-096443 TaxID=3239919 RepID=UPI003F49AC7F